MVSVLYSESDRRASAHLSESIIVSLTHDGYAPEDRERFRYVISDNGVTIAEGNDLTTGSGFSHPMPQVMETFLSFLSHYGESYCWYHLGNRTAPDAPLPDYAEWCYQHSDEITAAAMDCEGGYAVDLDEGED